MAQTYTRVSRKNASAEVAQLDALNNLRAVPEAHMCTRNFKVSSF